MLGYSQKFKTIRRSSVYGAGVSRTSHSKLIFKSNLKYESNKLKHVRQKRS